MYFCKVLSPQNQDGLQNCLEWVTFEFPSFTVAEASYISGLIILVFVVTWSFKHLGVFIQSFK